MNINADEFLLQVFFKAELANTSSAWWVAVQEINGALHLLRYMPLSKEVREIDSDCRYAVLIALDRQMRIVSRVAR